VRFGSESIAAEVESVLSRPEVLEKLHTGLIAARAPLLLLRAVAGRAGYIVSVVIPIISAPDFWGTLERVDR
jgi:hypothetical protein